ncbi:MAG TPA: hypothetical protein VIW68_07790 [Candidatus Sulfotelmatobacter sp.]
MRLDVKYVCLIMCGLFAQGQVAYKTHSAHPSPAPLYSISFERKNAVSGIDASPAIKLPFDCTSDGIVFVTMVPVGGQLHPPTFAPPPLLLVSVSPSGRTHTFPLDQPTEQLFDVREVDHYASESNVIFTIQAAKENKPVTQTYTKPDGTEGEFTRNSAEHNFYVVIFDRDGNYQKTVKLDVSIQVQQLGMFPSGVFLAFGFGEETHAPQLVMLKEDGTLLRPLQIRKGYFPESMFDTKDGSGKGSAVHIAPTQLVPRERSIIVVQNKTDYPLLEVSESGEVRKIPTHLPKGTTIEGLIPSDLNVFARVNPQTDGAIYELAGDGTVRRRFEIADNHASSGVACVYDGKFLSFEHGDGKLVPLVGTAKPSDSTVQNEPASRNPAK